MEDISAKVVATIDVHDSRGRSLNMMAKQKYIFLNACQRFQYQNSRTDLGLYIFFSFKVLKYK